jgi:uncharacterized membrane protein YgcG
MTGIDNHNAETLSVPAKTDEAPMERREVLRRFGIYAAVTAPAMTVLLASRQSEAMGSKRSGNGGGKSSGGGGGGGGFSL